jgi:hypothetical protein
LQQGAIGEDPMRLKSIATVLAVVGAIALLTAPADAAAKKKRVVTTRGNTVFVSRDEGGRKRTRIIIQKRSYLDPGTETFPGENTGQGYAMSPTHSASSVIKNTIFDLSTPLPGPFTLPGKNNPWIGY